MRHVTFFLIILALGAALARADSGVRVLSITGTATVRHGVGEVWAPLAAGDVLKPEDSIELGKGSAASLLLPEGRRITVTEQAIVNISDLRSISQEDLLLLLAMESVRSIPERPSPGGIPAPATTVHGSRPGGPPAPLLEQTAAGVMELRGAEVLFANGYFATCILRVKNTLRIHPRLPRTIDARLLAAEAMEKAGVSGEALAEYRSLLADAQELTLAQETLARRKVAELGRKN